MPNNSSDNSADAFTAFLAFLSEDPNVASDHYLRLHQKLAGYFRLKGMSDPLADADDALERAGKKILEGVAIPDIDRFCMGIAKNIVMERLRKKRREESAFVHFFEYSQNDNSLVDRITNLMKPCFEKLGSEDRDLLNSYCKVPPGKSRPNHRRELAERLKSTIAALRIRVTRLRRELEKCVKALSKNQ